MTRPRTQLFGLLLAMLLAGCQSSPVSFVATTPRPMGEMYPCALREVNERGYTVTNASRDGGFIAAEKRRGGVMQTLLARLEVDRLNMSIFDDTVPERRKVRLTVSATRDMRGETTAIDPSEEATADARALLATCAGESATR